MRVHGVGMLVWWVTLAATASAAGVQARIGREAAVPLNPRSQYNRYVNWRPADAEVVHLNPPRMSWPYWPDWPKNWKDEQHSFRLQISSRPDVSQPLVDVDSPFNFYNCLPELKGADRWYWRVGYDVGTKHEHWSPTRSFTVAADAVSWDRSALACPDLAALGHPRILFTRDSLARIRNLAKTDESSRACLEWMRRQADRVMEESWWKDFPKNDRTPEPKKPFHAIAHDLALVTFVWRMTGDDKYSGVKDRAVTWASYPPGGRSSPEGLGGDGSEDATQGNEFLSLLFDWLYQNLNEAERKTMIDSLTWRVDHVMNSFAWRARRTGGAMVRLTFGPEAAVDRAKGGDQRLRMAPASDWKPFAWEVEVPAGANRLIVEAFNYYSQGEVCWDSLHLRDREDGKDLLKNADFSDPEGQRPSGWRPNTFDTEAAVRFEPQGGRDASGAVMIQCRDSSQRGAWGQSISLQGPRRLWLDGWYRTRLTPNDAPVMASSLSGMISSHQYEASMDTAVCGLVLYEHSDIGRQWYELMVNYLAGVTCGHGFDGCWNEGPGYGTSKCKWLTDASLYFDTTLRACEKTGTGSEQRSSSADTASGEVPVPIFSFGRNPFYATVGEFFRRVIPVGMDHNAWGNQNDASRGNHLAMFRKLAYLTGDGRFLFNWQQYGGRQFSEFRPWIEYVLPAYYQEPEPKPEKENAALFDIDGWVMAATGPPSDRNTYENGVGLVFQCRPRGGFGHSFHSDGSFQLHAYGQMLNHGGGSSGNQDAFAYHSMSHNTILVDGLGQAQPSKGQLEPSYGRIVGFAQGKDYVYVAGDATRCYPRKPADYSRWGLPLDKVYQKRSVEHLERFVRHILFVRGKYFVIFDDLVSSRPAVFTWLYHIRPQEPLRFSPGEFAVDYAVGDVKVRLQHLAHPDELKLEDRQGLDGLVNPITGEDYRRWRKGDILCGHNLWVSNVRPASQWNFLTVVYPAAPGESIPTIQRIDDRTVRVGEEIVSFDPRSEAGSRADFQVDAAAMRGFR